MGALDEIGGYSTNLDDFCSVFGFEGTTAAEATVLAGLILLNGFSGAFEDIGGYPLATDDSDSVPCFVVTVVADRILAAVLPEAMA